MRILKISLATILCIAASGCKKEVGPESFTSRDRAYSALIYGRDCSNADCSETVIKISSHRGFWRFPKTAIRLKNEHQLFVHWQPEKERWKLEITCYNCSASDILENRNTVGKVDVAFTQSR
jgi:hypothetical protein